MLLFKAIAGKKGATPPSPLLFQSEEKEPVAEKILFWGLRIKEITAPFLKGTEHQPQGHRAQERISLFFLSSLARERLPFSIWLSRKSLAREGGETLFPAITLFSSQ